MIVSRVGGEDRESTSFDHALPAIRAARADLAIRPERWDTRFRLPGVDVLLQDPLRVPETAAAQARGLAGANSSSELLQQAGRWLDEAASTDPLPPESSDPVQDLLRAVA